MFKTYYKIDKKMLKKIYSDFDAIVKFEKNVNSVLSDKRLNPELKKKLSSSSKMMEGAENNTKRMRRELLEFMRDSKNKI